MAAAEAKTASRRLAKFVRQVGRTRILIAGLLLVAAVLIGVDQVVVPAKR